jgi:hypothetical protein
VVDLCGAVQDSDSEVDVERLWMRQARVSHQVTTVIVSLLND